MSSGGGEAQQEEVEPRRRQRIPIAAFVGGPQPLDECPYCKHVPRDQREIAVHRCMDGEPYHVNAVRAGVPRGCASHWLRDWERREGMWLGLPLTEEELARGWYIEQYHLPPLHVELRPDRVRETRTMVRAKQKTKYATPRNTFIKLLGNNQPPKISELREAWLALTDEDKGRFQVAFDLAIEAHELRNVAYDKRVQAIEMLSDELRAEVG